MLLRPSRMGLVELDLMCGEEREEDAFSKALTGGAPGKAPDVLRLELDQSLRVTGSRSLVATS